MAALPDSVEEFERASRLNASAPRATHIGAPRLDWRLRQNVMFLGDVIKVYVARSGERIAEATDRDQSQARLSRLR